MRLLLLTPGTGHSYCGSCLRDNALAQGLRGLGHDVLLAPLYLPLMLEGDPPAQPPAPEEPVRMGGVNLFLKQTFAPARFVPRALTALLDRPGVLRWAARRGSLTAAPGLGAMTVSMLRGEHGRQAREIEELAGWAASLARPDAILLANALLVGVARRLKVRAGAPVVCTLQGEAPFLDALREPHRSRAWEAARERARDVDAFIPVSRHYGALMAERLALPAERVHPVHNGIDLDGFRDAAPARPAQPTVGYLARMCRDKGLPTLVDAFVKLARGGRVPDVRLAVAGALLREDRALVAELEQRLCAAGLAERASFLPNVDRAQKLAFLRTLSVLSVPATYGESFGLYLLEALAAGVPVVQPDCDAFPEVLAETGGGLLCAPNDAEALARGLEELLLDEPRRAALAEQGRRAVLARFGAEQMASGVEAVCRMAARQGP